MLENWRGPPMWCLYTRLYNFVRNISTNISALGRRTHLKFGEMFSLFIVYNITIFRLCPLHTFWFYFLLRDSAHTLYDRCQTQRPKEFKECRPFQTYQSALGFPRISRGKPRARSIWPKFPKIPVQNRMEQKFSGNFLFHLVFLPGLNRPQLL